MFKKYIQGFVFFILGVFLLASNAFTEPSPPEKVKVGVFLTNIYDINFANQEFSASFWIWFLHTKKVDKPHKSFEIVNSKTIEILHESQENLADGRVLSLAKVSTKVITDWDVTSFPFDVHKLEIIIEMLGYSVKEIVYEQDCLNSILLDSTIKTSLQGWQTVGYDIPVSTVTYPSSFGNPVRAEYDTFSRITPTLYIKRDWSGDFVRLFLVLYFSFFLAVIEIFLPLREMNSKISLISISVATVIVSKFVVDSHLPTTGDLSLYSSIEAMTLWLLFSIGLYEIAALYFPKSKILNHRKQRFWFFLGIVSFYVITNIIWIGDTYFNYTQAFNHLKITCLKT